MCHLQKYRYRLQWRPSKPWARWTTTNRATNILGLAQPAGGRALPCSAFTPELGRQIDPAVVDSGSCEYSATANDQHSTKINPRHPTLTTIIINHHQPQKTIITHHHPSLTITKRASSTTLESAGSANALTGRSMVPSKQLIKATPTLRPGSQPTLRSSRSSGVHGWCFG